MEFHDDQSISLEHGAHPHITDVRHHCTDTISCAGQTKSSAESATTEFHPGELWYDTSGTPINAHGGGFLYRDHTYYWFGEFKTEGPGGNAANVGISCYSSKDLYHWKNEGIALKVSQDPASEIVAGSVLERPKVLYNKKTRNYVMWFHLELKGQGYSAARAGVAVSKRATGPYTYLRSFRPDGEMSRDMTLYADDDGKAYLITTSENNQTQHLSRLTDDYLDTTGHFTRIFAHKALEGAAIFKTHGHYSTLGRTPRVGTLIPRMLPWPILGGSMEELGNHVAARMRDSHSGTKHLRATGCRQERPIHLYRRPLETQKRD